MKKPLLGLLALSALSAVACSSTKPAETKTAASTAPAEKDKEPKDGVSRELTQGQLKIAHYASGDMMTGLVLDRSGERPKVKFDNAKDIVELTMVEDRHAGERRGWYMKSPDGNNVLYLTAWGRLTAYVGRDEIHLNSDKAAAALGAPTIAGEYKAPESTYDRNKAKWTALSLQAKKQDLPSEDSGNLAKVADALATTPVDQFVRLTEAGAKAARWAPASEKIGNTTGSLGGQITGHPASDTWEPAKATGLGKLGGKLIPTLFEYNSPNRLRLHTLKGWPPPVAAGTPGIVWEVHDRVVFVSVDGGRYELANSNEDVEYFEKGAGAPASWPAFNQHALVDVDTVRALEKANAIAPATAKDVADADNAWFECVNGVWKATKDQLDKIEASSAPANEKWGKLGGARKSAELDAPKKCEPTKQKLEKVLLKVIEDRTAQRKTIFEKTKARF